MVPMSPKCRSDQIQIVSSGPSQTIGLQSRACRISARACRSCMDGVSSIDVTPPVGAAAAAPRRTASAAAPRLPRVPSLRSQRSPGPFPVSALPYSALPCAMPFDHVVRRAAVPLDVLVRRDDDVDSPSLGPRLTGTCRSSTRWPHSALHPRRRQLEVALRSHLAVGGRTGQDDPLWLRRLDAPFARATLPCVTARFRDASASPPRRAAAIRSPCA